MFLESIRSFLCHNSASVAPHGSPGRIICTECGSEVMNAYEYIARTEFQDPFHSSRLARQYAEWSGDIRTPCHFPLTGIPGILPKLYHTDVTLLSHGVKLLKMVNAPFTSSPYVRSALDQKVLDHFFSDYVHMIDQVSSTPGREAEMKAVRMILQNMKSVFTNNGHIFTQYFDVLTPYVKQCAGQIPPLDEPPEEKEAEDTLAHTFLRNSHTSTWIRKTYGPFCIPFDVIHVMIYCYVLGIHDADGIANFVFDLGARICRGYFDTLTPFSERIQSIVSSSVSYNKHTDVYYLLRDIRNGDVKDNLSLEFLDKYAKLEKIVLDHVQKESNEWSQAMQFAFSQTFPFVLFPASETYYGFMIALGHLLSRLKSSKVKLLPKGTVANAKQLFTFAENGIRKVRDFEQGKEVRFWTGDVFQLFLGSDPTLHKEFTDMVELMIEEARQVQQE